ncbi:hypothetical protein A2715_01730 [Candidatus Woesebacteria bacterium RIFCSPHIGHO2_01_FULL_39_32]|uniref:Polymerase III subunit delta'''' protein n=2 Tax=Candidatus Woeseibacteriota TaxID=1752722 RepID=A0A0G0PLG4_9BACT|nr:MAG: polymerase III subunit delta'''' protein [Candidatus Woesebacteria bacterium GW2011_GWA1_39_8]OGM04547.1 MAG: hypothetical protein A2124_00995 [Candidatus Woesebacteria bacterium GWB1_37_5]OGM23879.1 MAG: hypothetical protein A2715_01730 [Candidatus Woesebacteria bacterium RIFCSPHIGHO2_01_FULL_39_32]OGM38656.1 MAG: hypothetical protein A3F01_02795 [Candidatus Woesebacteria bacterium RIFCSPHIGHO2_12_FULL_38_11]OGM64068.1 MAG: hypothetical protein A2893_02970 [Candidatus Woesebacteria bac
MHAYLIVGQDPLDSLTKAKELSKKVGETSYEFSITKIDEVRKLTAFVKLSFEKPTTIIITDIQSATEEALNAFLKNLEEPQKRLSYILITSSEEKLIPTIVSRCQVIRINKQESINKNIDKDLDKFIEMSIGEKFAYLDKIKKRDEAVSFLENLIYIWHGTLVKGQGNLKKFSESLKLTEKTHTNLQANGNVNLQLTNFVVNLTKLEMI